MVYYGRKWIVGDMFAYTKATALLAVYEVQSGVGEARYSTVFVTGDLEVRPRG